jgi:hypothetical protein
VDSSAIFYLLLDVPVKVLAHLRESAVAAYTRMQTQLESHVTGGDGEPAPDLADVRMPARKCLRFAEGRGGA